MSRCIICGKEIEKSEFLNADLCSSECFSVLFWNENLDDTAIIIDGICYHDGGRNKTHLGFRGFGGAEFKIQMNDGRIIETNNLWMNGKIPAERNIKDNAKFIKEKQENNYQVDENSNDLPF